MRISLSATRVSALKPRARNASAERKRRSLEHVVTALKSRRHLRSIARSHLGRSGKHERLDNLQDENLGSRRLKVQADRLQCGFRVFRVIDRKQDFHELAVSFV